MKYDKISDIKILLIILAATAVIFHLSGTWRKNLDITPLLMEDYGYTEIANAEAIKEIYCFKPMGFRDNQLDYKECEILEKPINIKRGDTIETSAGPIKINYLAAENQGMSIYSIPDKWSCMGVEDLEQIDSKTRDKAWIQISDCIPRACDPPILTQTPERGSLEHCINLVTGLSEFEN